MFTTEMETLENAFLLKVTFGLKLKRWAYRYLEELQTHRARLERHYIEGNLDTLREEMEDRRAA